MLFSVLTRATRTNKLQLQLWNFRVAAINLFEQTQAALSGVERAGTDFGVNIANHTFQ